MVDSTVAAMTAASALSGPELLYCVQSANDRKLTASQVATFAGAGKVNAIASGTVALGTSLIVSGASGALSTVSAPGALSTDVIIVSFNSDPTGVTGYTPAAMLTIIPWCSANNVNFKQCNLTGASITPAALTLNWKIVR